MKHFRKIDFSEIQEKSKNRFFFENFRFFRKNLKNLKFFRKNLKNHQKSKFFKKSKIFRKLLFGLITFLWLRNAGNEV